MMSRKSFLLRSTEKFSSDVYLFNVKEVLEEALSLCCEVSQYTDLKNSWVSRLLRAGRTVGSEVNRLTCSVLLRLSSSSSDTETDRQRSAERPNDEWEEDESMLDGLLQHNHEEMEKHAA